ncbi:interferon-induced GTP-binding protein Mx1 [Kockovaella imperatae]|uniref:Interferon-induced GTP-binding protein Mx1 n=1 Tax=Kockovaella imperatae TaxID=4999 RepID=A0A1Y1UBZ1_9TREE|nr:interferon-induced GTP-binding protein Mx1 [Kockovaella imperatae]ORX35006.1 interferon-induced GTP-binding protein Mx1 [Kockovaella imperatae]
MRTATSGLVDSKLLDKIDKLFVCGVGAEVELPQLVVVGNQSSGKSSVLEALTGIPFPRDDGLCTRFATRITFRRALETRYQAKIVPDKLSSKEHQDKCQQWGQELESFDLFQIADLMKKVRTVMGVSDKTSDSTYPAGSAFSNDVLSLEITGPGEEHFSIVDVPGTFKVEAEGVTTKEDIKLVDDMVKRYMTNSRSIMLTVVNCNDDISSHDIIQKARDIDPHGERTLGILTKPDLADEGAEQKIIDILDGKQHRLFHGWHILRNRGQKDLRDATSLSDRHATERKFFTDKDPWNKLDKSLVGIDALNHRLHAVLATQLNKEFPNVKKEIKDKLAKAQKEWVTLGVRRQTQAEQNQFLVGIAEKYRSLADSAVRGDYSRQLLKENETLKLARAIRQRSDRFARDVEIFGHQFDMRSQASKSPGKANGTKVSSSTENEDGPDEESQSSDDDDEESEEENIKSEEAEFKAHLPAAKTIGCRMEQTPDDLLIILPDDVTLERPSFKRKWLKEMYFRSQGTELIAIPPGLLGSLMAEQAKRWTSLAQGYTADIICLIHKFIFEAISQHATKEVYTELHSALMEDLEDSYKLALNHTSFILKCELQLEPVTHNHYFNDEIQKKRQRRQMKALETKSSQSSEGRKFLFLDQLGTVKDGSNNDYTVRELKDILQAYYKVARKRFVDVVRQQSVDWFLVRGDESPLRKFSPNFVLNLSPAELESIAGEPSYIKAYRAELEDLIKRMEEGMRILR